MSDDRPNVLLLFTDQQHAEMMGCAGNPHLETPAMDGIAERGVRFPNAFCANPVCSPSRTAMLTGRFPSAIGQRSNVSDHIDHVPDEIAAEGLGHQLRDAGYDVAYGGKEHLPGDLSIERLGFEYVTEDDRFGLVDSCREFLTADRDAPFVLAASFMNPHDICYMAINDYKRTVGEDLWGGCERELLELALMRPPGIDEAAFFEEHVPPLPDNHEPQTDEPEAIRELVELRPFRAYVREEWSARRWREHRLAYARLTQLVDRQIGQVLAALEESGQRDETVVIFCSDHGDMDGAHRLEHKTALYDEAVRVPFVIDDPRGRSGAVDERLVSLLDVLPTACDYGNRDVPEGPGRSVRPLVRGTDPDWRSEVRIESQLGEAIVRDRFRYVLYDEGANREQLYDHRVDPGETRNHAADHPDVVAELRSQLLEGGRLH